MKPARVQLSRAKGWRMPANTVKVDRTTEWGNPFRVGESISMKLANRWCWKIKNPSQITETAELAVRRFAGALAFDEASHGLVRSELGGRNLACWCALGAPCHADVLLELANAPADQEPADV